MHGLEYLTPSYINEIPRSFMLGSYEYPSDMWKAPPIRPCVKFDQINTGLNQLHFERFSPEHHLVRKIVYHASNLMDSHKN